MDERDRVIIIGAGITGLSLAYELKKAGVPFLLLEARANVGGSMGTLEKNGFELDLGPVTCAKNQSLADLVEGLGLQDKVRLPSRVVKKRFIYSKGRLHAVSAHPLKLLTNPIVSAKARMSFLRDMALSAGQYPTDESVASFIRRHFHEDILNYLFDPVLGGIYAGDVEKLSILSVLPMLKEIEAKHGSLIKGLWKRRKQLSARREIISFKGGFQTLLSALQHEVIPDLLVDRLVKTIEKENDGYSVVVDHRGKPERVVCRKIVLTVPAPEAAEMLKGMESGISETLKSIPYRGLTQVYCSIPNKHSGNFEGFGFLIPSIEKKSLLGAVNNSSLFPEKAAEGFNLWTLFFKHETTGLVSVLSDFISILGLSTAPEIHHVQKWGQAIPQFEVGYPAIRETLKDFETRCTGIHMAGSYISGVSVGDCVKFAQAIGSRFYIKE
jgi:protoporphyrinogen/coproporphyrinogen III oxidase